MAGWNCPCGLWWRDHVLITIANEDRVRRMRGEEEEEEEEEELIWWLLLLATASLCSNGNKAVTRPTVAKSREFC